MDTTALVAETASRLFEAEIDSGTRRAADVGGWSAGLWDALEAAGLTKALLPESAGGFGIDAADALQVLRIAGEHAAPVPLAEMLLAGWVLAWAGLPVPDGPLSLAPVLPDETLALSRDGAGWHFRGHASRIPWARETSAIAVLAEGEGAPMLALVERGGWSIAPDSNLAGEPRDAVTFDARLSAEMVRPLPAGLDSIGIRALGAATRAILIGGAVRRVLHLTVRYATERVQFGRPIGKFQAVQQNLAVLAGQAAAADAAAAIAIDAFAAATEAGGSPSLLAIAAAKVRAGEAASQAASIAHQIHGAIGFTQEHLLHYWTKRLWSWRDEFGNEAEWAGLIGRHVSAGGADRLWPEITAAA